MQEITKMTRALSLIAGLIFVGANLAGDAKLTETTKKELVTLQGRWLVERLETKDKKVDLGELNPSLILEVKGAKFILNGQPLSEVAAIDPSTNPKCLDIRRLENGKPTTLEEGIFKLDGDALFICVYQGGGKQRPTTFDTANQADTTLVVLKRLKK
jgi:uncharacterized protein (TIGR03067 family)